MTAFFKIFLYERKCFYSLILTQTLLHYFDDALQYFVDANLLFKFCLVSFFLDKIKLTTSFSVQIEITHFYLLCTIPTMYTSFLYLFLKLFSYDLMVLLFAITNSIIQNLNGTVLSTFVKKDEKNLLFKIFCLTTLVLCLRSTLLVLKYAVSFKLVSLNFRRD